MIYTENTNDFNTSYPMKKMFIVLCVLGILPILLKAQTKQDSAAIRVTVLNYIEGWTSGDSARMALSLHPLLAKRGIVPSRTGKGTEMLSATYKEMVSWTVFQKNAKKEIPQQKDEIFIDKIGRNIASVTCISSEYIDYLHLARTGKGWKILNAIWEPNYSVMEQTRADEKE